MEKIKIKITVQATEDIMNIKRYILETFKYREYANNFVKDIKKAISPQEYGVKEPVKARSYHKPS